MAGPSNTSTNNEGQEVANSEPERSTLAPAQGRDEDPEEQTRTPLPKFQLLIVLLIQFSEPITATVIYPFVNQFVRDTGITKGDDRTTGYYAGVIESAFFFAEAATVFQWGWLSDRIGRRPVLLLGPLGLTFAMLKFGYSTSFWSMLLSRCFQGVFNGNIGVSKTVLVELSDSTNIADAYAMIPPMWSTGVTVAPIMGGVLSDPANRWPSVFGKFAFFKWHPYFLPCLAAGFVSFFTFMIGFLGLKETHPSRSASEKLASDEEQRNNLETRQTSSTDTLLRQEDVPDYGTTSNHHASTSTTTTDSIKFPRRLSESDSEPVTLRSVFASQRMQLIIINYLFQAFTQMSYMVLMPLIFSTSIKTGGLGLSPYEIGLTMGIWGFLNAFVQIFFFGKIVRKFGGAFVYKVACTSYIFCFLTFPISTYLARRNGGVGFGSCAAIVIQLIFRFFAAMGYGAVQVLVAESTPKPVLGSVNGLVQMAGCVIRTVAPTFASSLFSVSIQEQILGGYFVYLVICSILVVAICFSRGLTDLKVKGKSI